MKRLQRQLPHPVTDQDKSFMAYLLAGVRAKREQAAKGIQPRSEGIPPGIKSFKRHISQTVAMG